MNLSCTARSMKYFMYFFNFLYVITGIILIAIGGTIKAKYMQFDTFLDTQYFSLPNLLIATGILIFLIAFIGCYGAIKESWVILLVFSVLLVVVFVFEFAAGIAGYVLRDKTSSYLEKTFYDNIKNYNKSDGITRMWDIIQYEFQCCGVRGPEDWNVFEDFALPVTCCPTKFGIIGTFTCNNLPKPITQLTSPATSHTTDSSPASPASPTSPTSPTPSNTTTTAVPSTTTPFTTGCEEAFGKFVKTHAIDIGAVGFSFAIIQIVGIGFSFYLVRQLKNQYYST